MQKGGDLDIESGAKSAERGTIAFYFMTLGGILVAVPVREGLVGRRKTICKTFLFWGGWASRAGEEGREGHIGR